MREEIHEAVSRLSNRYITKWKSEGGKVIGFPCTYVPAEILWAAGILPVRMRAMEAMSTSIGDTYFGPVVCSFPKCLLQMAGEGKYSFLDGAIICNGCDTMRRLDDCWRKMGEDIQGALPPYLFHYAAPHKVTDYSLKWFVDETRRFIASLEERFGCRITEDGLRKAIRIYNRGRELLGRLDELRMGERVLISGTEAMAVMIAGTAMPPDVFNELLEEVLAEVECRQEGIPGKRLLLAGSVIDDLDLLRVIEEEGAVVVADTLCFGSRSHKDAVAEDGDPVEAIARRYLDAIYCPRMFGYYKQRFAFLREMAERAGVEGVILQNIRFCDLHGSENGIFERDLEAAGIPCMKMEREYGPLGEEGRIKMRIDAFLERISERKEQP